MPAPPKSPLAPGKVLDLERQEIAVKISMSDSADGPVTRAGSLRGEQQPPPAPRLLERISSFTSEKSSVSKSPKAQVALHQDAGHPLRGPSKSRTSLTSGVHSHHWLKDVVESRSFDVAMGLVILANCVTMGIEAEIFLGHMLAWQEAILISENVFTVLFLAEVLLRVFASGWRYYVPGFGGSWSQFGDLCIVLVTGVGGVWIMPSLDLEGSTAVQTLTVLRSLRLVRMVRVVSRMPAFNEVWLLLRGLSESLRTLFWTIVVIFFITYVFAIFGVVVLTTALQIAHEKAASSDDRETLENLLGMTNGVMPMMFTLIQVLTLDSWTSFVREVMEFVPWCWAYFYLYVAIAVFVLMNLVTAIIVETALNNSQKDMDALVAERERERLAALKQFRTLFAMIDQDGNGFLTRDEFREAFNEPEIAKKLKMLDIEPKDCEEIFNLLDSGDGVLSLSEFFEGITRMEGVAQSKDVFKVLKRVDQFTARAKDENLPPADKGKDGSLEALKEIMVAVSACNNKVDKLAADVSELRANQDRLTEDKTLQTKI